MLAVPAAFATYGRLDILHNHAGILHPKDGPITELSAEAIDETFNTNCKGMLFTVKYAARQMIKQSGGGMIRKPSLNFSQRARIVLDHSGPLHLGQLESSE